VNVMCCGLKVTDLQALGSSTTDLLSVYVAVLQFAYSWSVQRLSDEKYALNPDIKERVYNPPALIQ